MLGLEREDQASCSSFSAALGAMKLCRLLNFFALFVFFWLEEGAITSVSGYLGFSKQAFGKH